MTTETSEPNPDTKTPPGPPLSPRPPHGPSLLTIGLFMTVALVALVIGALASGWMKKGWTTATGVLGHDHGDHAVVLDGEGGVQYFTCGMHPWVLLPRPGDCPICHMKLTPINPAKFTGEIVIDPVVTQNIGVRIEPVATGPLVRRVHTVGHVDYDETRVRDVNIKIDGWIEKLHVDYVGARVKEGDPLFDLYSPELYETQREYLLAWQYQKDSTTDTARNAKTLLEAVRTKLVYLDVTDQQIEALQRRGQPKKTLTIRSPHTGVVIAKHANEGMKVDPGMQVYRVADLSKIWVVATFYEYQMPYVTQGQRVTMTLPYIPGQKFEGKVMYIYPYLDQQTRQVQARLEFDNTNGLLKPGMYVNVELTNKLAVDRILAPLTAVINTGKRQVAFVSLGEGKFEPRDVRTGIETEGGMIEILDGLRPGEMVVTSGQFLIDSEAKMREALAKMTRGELAADQKAAAAVRGQSELDSLPQPMAQTLNDVLDAYFAVSNRLVHDTTDGIETPARNLAAAMDKLIAIDVPDHAHFWHEHTEAATVRGKALELLQENDMARARLRFSDLSVALSKLVSATGVPPTYGRQVLELHCPMYRDDQSGSVWLQPDGDVLNPYMGQRMPACFDERHALPVTGSAKGTTDPAGIGTQD